MSQPITQKWTANDRQQLGVRDRRLIQELAQRRDSRQRLQRRLAATALPRRRVALGLGEAAIDEELGSRREGAVTSHARA
jgi:hypothetical protein